MARPSESAVARRLLALLPFLGEQGRVPLARLAAATGSDEATVAADISLLSVCGSGDRGPDSLVGVYVDDETGAAEVFLDLPALDRPLRLTGAEARALGAALEAVGVAESDELAHTLASHAARTRDLAEVARTVRASFAPGTHGATIAALSYATLAHRVVRIAYTGGSRDTETLRDVRPYTLYLWRGAWYLQAYDESVEEERTFRVDRIAGASMQERVFAPPASPSGPSEPLPDLDSMPKATIRFSADAPDLNERDWPGAAFSPQADGSVIGVVPYAGTGWIARKVAARLGEAVVEAPPEVRCAVAEAARRALEAL